MQFECQCRRRMLRNANKRWALPCRLHLGFSTSSPWPHLRAPRPARRTITVSLADLQSGVLILLLRSRLTASHLKLSTEVTQAESLLRDHIVNLLTIHRVCFVLLAIPNFRNELVLLPGKEARLAAHGPRQQGIGWAGVIRADAASSTQRSLLAQQTSDLSKGHRAPAQNKRLRCVVSIHTPRLFIAPAVGCLSAIRHQGRQTELPLRQSTSAGRRWSLDLPKPCRWTTNVKMRAVGPQMWGGQIATCWTRP
jgi:hypothetical protein